MTVPARAAQSLTVIAAASAIAAWAVQASAAADLRAAHQLSTRDVPEGDAAPESVARYRAILTTLDESIRIRRRIDMVLADVEELAALLAADEATALAISDRAANELRAVGALLGGGVEAAGTSLDRLDVLERRLHRTKLLAALIAEELEELDRSLGP